MILMTSTKVIIQDIQYITRKGDMSGFSIYTSFYSTWQKDEPIAEIIMHMIPLKAEQVCLWGISKAWAAVKGEQSGNTSDLLLLMSFRGRRQIECSVFIRSLQRSEVYKLI
ncbi:hypothetical protein FGO68_gene10249 [Halteria grandinella]|uniref:Uncharacterized protein n=1 Tax=Halteria grandinella TaxID=5974 RepID=A0A8J8NPD5_HALGN|nr:hypothetical protein FGO68_gene10249 [Halteria grandinella]